jgi:hypothetical protein
MDSQPPIIEYRADPAPRRTWGLSRPVWGLICGFCVFVELAANFATNGRVNGWGDIVFIIGFAAAGLVAFINTVRPPTRAG